jgi:thymidylate synthase (FAD)
MFVLFREKAPVEVKLISITKPLGDVAHLTPEELIVYTARISNPSNQMNMSTAPKLLSYCLNNKHFSIFETVNMTVEIQTSRSISTQLLRHRSFVFQEYSQRYSTVSTFETYNARRQDKKNRQNSIDDMSEKEKDWFLLLQKEVHNTCEKHYNTALEMGVAKELARMLLPLSTTTTLYMTGNVRSWITYLMARLDKSTQLEHRQIAEEIKKIFIGQFPSIAVALNWKENDDECSTT